MLNAIEKNLHVCMLLLNASVLLPCNSPSLRELFIRQQEAQDKPGSKRSGNTNKAPHDPVTDGWMQGATATAWQAFIQDGRYRWAGPDDFLFPDWTKQGYRLLDIERAMKAPIQAGHIKGSYKSIEVALIVVDTTRTDGNRYGVVIFSAQSNQSKKCEVKWLFQERDLSRVALGWSSGDTLGLLEYLDDGSYKSCQVKWNGKTQRYLCNLRQIKFPK